MDKILFALLIIIFFLVIATCKKKEYFSHINNHADNLYVPMMRDYSTLRIDAIDEDQYIPRNVYQTWHTKVLPEHMKNNYEDLKKQNPEFTFYLYDDDDCRSFIGKNFDSRVLWAYDSLVPGAYRADIWRYCVLYINGGIYLDIKFRCVDGFKLAELTDHEHYVKDVPSNFQYGDLGIYQALMVQRARNPLMMKCVSEIVSNVVNDYYGPNPLYPTGPGLMGKLYKKYRHAYRLNRLDMLNLGDSIQYKDRIILSHYPEYRKEQRRYEKTTYYAILWMNHRIYKYDYDLQSLTDN